MGTFNKQNGTCKRYFFIMRIFIPNFSAIAYAIDKQSGTSRRYLQVSKLQHMYIIGLILLSVLKTKRHGGLFPATNYCTRLQGVKERIT